MIGFSSNTQTNPMDRLPVRGAFGGPHTASVSDRSSQADAAALYTALDTDASGGVSSTELQSFIDNLDSDTRSALLALQEQASSASGSTTTGDGTSTSGTSSSGTSTSATTADLVSTLMSALDVDGDGSVSESELTAAAAPPPPPPPFGSRGPGGPVGGPPEADAGSSSSTPTASFSDIDTNGDGSISQSEYETWVAAQTSSSGSTTDTSTTSDASTGSSAATPAAAAPDFAAIMAQLMMRSYAKADAGLSSTLVSSVDTAA